jgi:hypothetical protein
VFSSHLKPKVGNIIVKTASLWIFLNIDDTPILLDHTLTHHTPKTLAYLVFHSTDTHIAVGIEKNTHPSGTGELYNLYSFSVFFNYHYKVIPFPVLTDVCVFNHSSPPPPTPNAPLTEIS